MQKKIMHNIISNRFYNFYYYALDTENDLIYSLGELVS